MSLHDRSLAAPAFPDDDGLIDPRLAAALGDDPAVFAIYGEVRVFVPIVAVLGERDIGQIDTIDALADRVAGLQVAISNGSQATFQIRGLGAVDHQALTPSAAAVNVDGVFLATNVQAASLAYDLARVEVLKGPQSLFFGKGSPGGVISLRTADPGAEAEIIGRAAYEFEAHTRRGELIEQSVAFLVNAMLGGPAPASGESEKPGKLNVKAFKRR